MQANGERGPVYFSPAAVIAVERQALANGNPGRRLHFSSGLSLLVEDTPEVMEMVFAATAITAKTHRCKPGDIVVLSAEKPLRVEERERLYDIWNKSSASEVGAHVIVLDQGIKLEVVNVERSEAKA